MNYCKLLQKYSMDSSNAVLNTKNILCEKITTSSNKDPNFSFIGKISCYYYSFNILSCKEVLCFEKWR